MISVPPCLCLSSCLGSPDDGLEGITQNIPFLPQVSFGHDVCLPQQHKPNWNNSCIDFWPSGFLKNRFPFPDGELSPRGLRKAQGAVWFSQAHWGECGSSLCCVIQYNERLIGMNVYPLYFQNRVHI